MNVVHLTSICALQELCAAPISQMSSTNCQHCISIGYLILTPRMDSEYSTPEKNKPESIRSDSADTFTNLNVRKLNPT